jgi:glycosyltransferase involved in cell wall biosynthesis
MTARTTVVIPHFQRAAEPLTMAVRSVLQQVGVQTPDIVIVDDGSPYPAKEIVAKHFAQQLKIRVIGQRNGGASHARNVGLAAVEPTADFIAFLDSDDQWSSGHIQSAVQALEGGGDMYFSDHRRTDWTESKFASIASQVPELDPVDSEPRILTLSGNFIHKILQLHMISTSSVVIRRSRLGHLRFRRDLILGEDEVFWIEAIRQARGVFYSKELEVLAGPGSVSQNHAGDIERELALAAKNIYFWHRISEYLPNEPEVVALQSQRLRQLESGYASMSLSGLRRGKFASSRDLVQVTLARPRWLLVLASLLRAHIGTRLAPRR